MKPRKSDRSTRPSGSNQERNSGLSRYEEVSSANASVITGSVNPPLRIAG